jgi:hypothetical protein
MCAYFGSGSYVDRSLKNPESAPLEGGKSYIGHKRVFSFTQVNILSWSSTMSHRLTNTSSRRVWVSMKSKSAESVYCGLIQSNPSRSK